MTGHGGAPGQQPDFVWRNGRDSSCSVFRWGFSWVDGGRQVSARWEDVDGIGKSHDDLGFVSPVAAGTFATRFTYTVLLTDGRSVTFSQTRSSMRSKGKADADLQPVPGTAKVVKIEQLGHLLEKGVTSALLPLAIKAFDAGRTVPFGRLSVSSEGIGADDRLLPWTEVKDALVWLEWYVAVRKPGKLLPWKSVPVEEVPNYCIFVALVRAIVAR